MATKTKTPTKKKELKYLNRDEFELEEIAFILTEAKSLTLKMSDFLIYIN
ncbi:MULTISPECIES: hypothetical protein [unclassified Lysinibacillus]|nr:MULTISPECIES: hypothetical protein [unclassified Lysinibacillus]MDM5247236.1 hypothetical protein [Lysinibacillus sp. G4S2]